MMKAAYYDSYGPPEVLRIKDISKPAPSDRELLIQVFASAVNSADWRMRKADPFMVRLFFGLTRPNKNVLGVVLAGKVEAVGAGVEGFQPGNKIFGMTGMAMGAHAEYAVIPDTSALAPIPKGITWAQAATIPFGATTAMHFLRQVDIREGRKVLIYGASGAVGTAAVQLAAHFGAEVTGVCSTRNVELVRSLGAERVIDYKKEDFSKLGETWDVIFETVNRASYNQCLRALSPTGTLVLGASMGGETFRGALTRMTSKRKVITGVAREESSDLLLVKELIEKGEYTPVVDREYPLDDVVEAHRYVEQGRKIGNVALVIRDEPV